MPSPGCGAALCYCGPRAVRCGGYRFWAFVVMCRAALRRVRRLRRNLLVSLLRSRAHGPSSQLLCGLRAEGWLGVAGDVFYRPSSAIGMCAGGMVAFWGAKRDKMGSFCSHQQDDVSGHAEGSLSAERSAKRRPRKK